MNIILLVLLYVAAISIPLIISIMIVKEGIIELYKQYLPGEKSVPLAPFFFDIQRENSSPHQSLYHIRERACGNCIVFTSRDMKETEKKLVELLRINKQYKFGVNHD